MSNTVFWFRRDLRFEDNTGLLAALSGDHPVIPVFIFDESILSELPPDDPRVNFIYKCLKNLDEQLRGYGSGLLVFKGEPLQVLSALVEREPIVRVVANKDYEPYARQRDREVGNMLRKSRIDFDLYKDQVIFEEHEVVKDNGDPYHVFTPYKNKWLRNFHPGFERVQVDFNKFMKQNVPFPDLEEIGFRKSGIVVRDFDISRIGQYGEERDFPAKGGNTHLGPHLRFGTVSIRKLIAKAGKSEAVFLSELIWREFFMQILFHYPRVVDHNFKRKYDGVVWRNNKLEFERWKEGKTGYAMVDAGMRELNQTGYMHNRVRMITAGFLCKHLLIDWRWGEAYFASKLLDYELASNNGNWQWAAGTGCDAAPYFRIFNPEAQQKKFDRGLVYVRRWIPEYDSSDYPEPMVDHSFARERALRVYREGVG